MIGKMTAIVGAALCARVLVSFDPGAAPEISGGALMQSSQPVSMGDLVSVNRANKGDRLRFEQRTGTTPQTEIFVPHRIPLGCDATFSPIASPKAAYFFGRCLT